MQSHALLLSGTKDFSQSFDEVSLLLDRVFIKGALSLIFFELVLDAGGVLDLGDEVFEFNNFGLFTL